MQIQEMKKGLFGYKKESVYQYVSALNEEFSQKLIEKDEKNEVLVKELRERTQALEAELERVKRESEDLRKKQLAVSDSTHRRPRLCRPAQKRDTPHGSRRFTIRWKRA